MCGVLMIPTYTCQYTQMYIGYFLYFLDLPNKSLAFLAMFLLMLRKPNKGSNKSPVIVKNMSKKINTLQLARLEDEIIALRYIALTFFMCIYLVSQSDYQYLLIIPCTLFFIFLLSAILAKKIPHLCIKNSVLFIYKFILFKPHKIEIEHIEKIKLIYIEKGMQKGAGQFIFYLKSGNKFKYTLGENDELCNKVKSFLENYTKLRIL